MKTKEKHINGYTKIRHLSYCFMAVTLIFLFFGSCKKFIQIPAPSSQLVTASVFNNNAAATSAITQIYTEMYNNTESFDIALFNGQLADELTQYNKNSIPFEYYTNNMAVGANTTTAFGEWAHAYTYIYQANAVITGLQQYNGASPAVKQQLMGEAYFIRGFWHFYLTNTYGAVPVALTTDYT